MLTLCSGLHLPQRSPMSPSTLDPNLVPETLEFVYRNFYNNRSVILQMHNENEMFLATWCANFGAPLPHIPRGSGSVISSNNPYAGALAATQMGSKSNHSNGLDPTQARFEGAKGNLSQFQVPGATKPQPPNQRVVDLSQNNPYVRAPFRQSNRSSPNRQGDRRDHAPSAQFNGAPIVQVYPRQPHIGAQNSMSNQPSTRNDSKDPSPERKDSKVSTPQPPNMSRNISSQMGSAQNPAMGGTMPNTWFHNAIAGAKLPTSEISQQAMQAGIDFRPLGHEQQVPNKPKPRKGRKPAVNPQRGVHVSENAAKTMMKMGAVDATGPAPIEPRVGVAPPSFTNGTAPKNGVLPNHSSQPMNATAQQYATYPNYGAYHYAARPPNQVAGQNGNLPSYMPQHQFTGVSHADSNIRSVSSTPYLGLEPKLTFIRPSKAMTQSAHPIALHSAHLAIIRVVVRQTIRKMAHSAREFVKPRPLHLANHLQGTSVATPTRLRRRKSASDLALKVQQARAPNGSSHSTSHGLGLPTPMSNHRLPSHSRTTDRPQLRPVLTPAPSSENRL